jgi:aminopeptidase N
VIVGMRRIGLFEFVGLVVAFCCGVVLPAVGQSTQQKMSTVAPAAAKVNDKEVAPSRLDLLRGAYGEDRSNNDLISYHLDIRVDPEKKYISGKNTIRFKMLKDGKRIHLDLNEALKVDRILLVEDRGRPTEKDGGADAPGHRQDGDVKSPLQRQDDQPAHGRDGGARSAVRDGVELKYSRDSGAVFVDFPEVLRKGQTYAIDFYYSGNPVETGRFGSIAFKTDPAGHPWINTACEETGASMWWPNKDQWRDEVEEMEISVAVPNGLVDVSNGRFVGKTDLGDGYTRWDWMVHYPINNYDVSLNIGNYEHFADKLGDLTLDFYALPQDLEKANRQFSQAKAMLEAYQHYFGEYPFVKDGYKLIEVPYSGMEHQSAVTYGNHFANGYLERDWTGVGISPRFDFIIIHESGHEWFGNSVTAADRSDMWIHEGWTTYLEGLYVEYRWGHDDAIKYLNGLKPKIKNQRPIVTERGVNGDPPEDQYFKGALMLNTLRSVINDDNRWWPLLYNFYQQFKYRNIMTEDVVGYMNQYTGMNLTPIFDQYLRYTAIPTLELKFDDRAGMVKYRWKADVTGFAMPVKVGSPSAWEIVKGTENWQTLKTGLKKDDFQVAEDLYYVNVEKE